MLKPSSPLNVEFEEGSAGGSAVAEPTPDHTPAQLFSQPAATPEPEPEPEPTEPEPTEPAAAEPEPEPTPTPAATPDPDSLAKAIAEGLKQAQPAETPPQLTPEEEAKLLKIVQIQPDHPLVKAFTGETDDEKAGQAAAQLLNTFANDVMQMTVAHTIYGVLQPELEKIRAELAPVKQTTAKQAEQNFYSTLYAKEEGLKQHPRIVEMAAQSLNAKAQAGQYNGGDKTTEQLADDLIQEASALAKEFNPDFTGFGKPEPTEPPANGSKPQAAPTPAALSAGGGGGSRAPRVQSKAEALSPRALFGPRR